MHGGRWGALTGRVARVPRADMLPSKRWGLLLLCLLGAARFAVPSGNLVRGAPGPQQHPPQTVLGPPSRPRRLCFTFTTCVRVPCLLAGGLWAAVWAACVPVPGCASRALGLWWGGFATSSIRASPSLPLWWSGVGGCRGALCSSLLVLPFFARGGQPPWLRCWLCSARSVSSTVPPSNVGFCLGW